MLDWMDNNSCKYLDNNYNINWLHTSFTEEHSERGREEKEGNLWDSCEYNAIKDDWIDRICGDETGCGSE